MATPPITEDKSSGTEQVDDADVIIEEFKGTPNLFRKIKFEIASIRAEMYHIKNKVIRDIKQTWNMQEIIRMMASCFNKQDFKSRITGICRV